jgi:hypothetical protein
MFWFIRELNKIDNIPIRNSFCTWIAWDYDPILENAIFFRFITWVFEFYFFPDRTEHLVDDFRIVVHLCVCLIGPKALSSSSPGQRPGECCHTVISFRPNGPNVHFIFMVNCWSVGPDDKNRCKYFYVPCSPGRCPGLDESLPFGQGSVPYISFINIYFVLFTNGSEFILKCHSSVVFRLLIDIINDLIHDRLTNGKYSISILPIEQAQIRRALFDPFGCLALQYLNQVGDCNGAREAA